MRLALWTVEFQDCFVPFQASIIDFREIVYLISTTGFAPPR